MSARGTDWGLAALVACLVATGALTVFAGGSGDAWVFAAHDALGVSITLLLVVKLRRVWSRVITPRRWEWPSVAGLLGLGLVVVALGSGVLWASGATPSLAGYSLLTWHDALGALLAAAVLAHMLVRAKPLRRQDAADRRQFLVAAGALGASALAWRLQRPVAALVGLRGARRRFTGSYEVASFEGNTFPTTSWVADAPRPIDAAQYRLRVDGIVTRPLLLSLGQLPAIDELVATLDCTGGFYSSQRWRGVRLGRLIDQAGALAGAHHVRVVSRTGYRWGFSLADARSLLLATHVGEEALSHDHGAPARLVVPNARGFQWVKWVTRIELLEHPDYGAPASTIWSSFTAAGSGG